MKYLFIFGDGTALAIHRNLETIVHAKPRQELLKGLFQALNSPEVEHAPSVWSPLHEGIFMTLLCARAQRISVLDNDSLRFLIEPKVQELFSALGDGVSVSIQYDEALPVTIVDWPAELPTLADIFRLQPQQNLAEWCLKMASARLSKELWDQIPEIPQPQTVPRGEYYDSYNKRFFFHDTTGTYEVKRARATPNGRNCVSEIAGLLEVSHFVTIGNGVMWMEKIGYRFWPKDVGIKLEVTEGKAIVLPESIFSSQTPFFQQIIGSARKTTFFSGDYLFKGVAVYQRGILDKISLVPSAPSQEHESTWNEAFAERCDDKSANDCPLD